jgi:hypothetical protein
MNRALAEDDVLIFPTSFSCDGDTLASDQFMVAVNQPN